MKKVPFMNLRLQQMLRKYAVSGPCVLARRQRYAHKC